MRVFKKKDSAFAGAIVGLTGDYADAIFRLDRDEVIVFGRDPKTSQIVMGEDCHQVSRTHCSVRCDWLKNVYFVLDQSKNGSYINGERLPYNEETEVSRGCVLAVGDDKNTFRLI